MREDGVTYIQLYRTIKRLSLPFIYENRKAYFHRELSRRESFDEGLASSETYGTLSNNKTVF